MRRLAVYVSAGLVVCAQIAAACGDKLVPIGGSVRMERITRSAYPGTVFVLSSTSATDRHATELDLVAGLAKTGHQARLISSADELQSAIREHSPDVVLADPDDLATVRARFGSGATAPVILVVLVRPNRTQLDAARHASGCVAAVPDWGVSPVVRVVNSIRASQESGRSVECAERLRTQT
jgi:hypothetical protein